MSPMLLRRRVSTDPTLDEVYKRRNNGGSMGGMASPRSIKDRTNSVMRRVDKWISVFGDVDDDVPGSTIRGPGKERTTEPAVALSSPPTTPKKERTKESSTGEMSTGGSKKINAKNRGKKPKKVSTGVVALSAPTVTSPDSKITAVASSSNVELLNTKGHSRPAKMKQRVPEIPPGDAEDIPFPRSGESQGKQRKNRLGLRTRVNKSEKSEDTVTQSTTPELDHDRKEGQKCFNLMAITDPPPPDSPVELIKGPPLSETTCKIRRRSWAEPMSQEGMRKDAEESTSTQQIGNRSVVVDTQPDDEAYVEGSLYGETGAFHKEGTYGLRLPSQRAIKDRVEGLQRKLCSPSSMSKIRSTLSRSFSGESVRGGDLTIMKVQSNPREEDVQTRKGGEHARKGAAATYGSSTISRSDKGQHHIHAAVKAVLGKVEQWIPDMDGPESTKMKSPFGRRPRLPMAVSPTGKKLKARITRILSSHNSSSCETDFPVDVDEIEFIQAKERSKFNFEGPFKEAGTASFELELQRTAAIADNGSISGTNENKSFDKEVDLGSGTQNVTSSNGAIYSRGGIVPAARGTTDSGQATETIPRERSPQRKDKYGRPTSGSSIGRIPASLDSFARFEHGREASQVRLVSQTAEFSNLDVQVEFSPFHRRFSTPSKGGVMTNGNLGTRDSTQSTKMPNRSYVSGAKKDSNEICTREWLNKTEWDGESPLVDHSESAHRTSLPGESRMVRSSSEPKLVSIVRRVRSNHKVPKNPIHSETTRTSAWDNKDKGGGGKVEEQQLETPHRVKEKIHILERKLSSPPLCHDDTKFPDRLEDIKDPTLKHQSDLMTDKLPNWKSKSEAPVKGNKSKRVHCDELSYPPFHEQSAFSFPRKNMIKSLSESKLKTRVDDNRAPSRKSRRPRSRSPDCKTMIQKAIELEEETIERIRTPVAVLIDQFSANKHFRFSGTEVSGTCNIHIGRSRQLNSVHLDAMNRQESLNDNEAVDDSGFVQKRRRSSALKSIDHSTYEAVASVDDSEFECNSGEHNEALDVLSAGVANPQAGSNSSNHRAGGGPISLCGKSVDHSLYEAIKSVDESEFECGSGEDVCAIKKKSRIIEQPTAETNDPIHGSKPNVIVLDFESMEPPTPVRNQHKEVVKDLKDLMQKAKDAKENENQRRIKEKVLRDLLESSKTWGLANQDDETGPANDLTVDEVSDIVTHINLCEQTNTPIRWDLINDILFPASPGDEPEQKEEIIEAFESISNQEKPVIRLCTEESTDNDKNIISCFKSQVENLELKDEVHLSEGEGDVVDAFRTRYSISEEELADVIAHLKLSEESNTPVRWDLIHQIIHPEETMDVIKALCSNPNNMVSDFDECRSAITEGFDNESHVSWFSIYPEFDDSASSLTFLVENEEIKVGKKSGRTGPGRDTTIHELIDEFDCPTFMFHDGNRGAVRSSVTNGLSASRHDGPERRLRKHGQGRQESIPVPDQLSSNAGNEIPPKNDQRLANHHCLNDLLESMHSPILHDSIPSLHVDESLRVRRPQFGNMAQDSYSSPCLEDSRSGIAQVLQGSNPSLWVEETVDDDDEES